MAIYLPIVSEFKPGGVNAADKAIKNLDSRASRFSASLGKVGKVAGAAFLGIGAAAGGAAYAAVNLAKAAAEDAASAGQLERQLKNTTNATDAQVAAVEDWITKTSLATGVTDDELRPALAALVRGSGDAEKAQKDLGLAMDISAGTGKSLDSVSQALAKAYGGNVTALKKLDPRLAKIIEKGGTTDEVFGQLADTFKGAGKEAANSADGQFKRLTVAFDEAKESLGRRLLPIILKVVQFLTDKVIPIVEKVIAVFDKDGLSGVWDLLVSQAKKVLPKIGAFLKDLLVKIKDALLAAGEAFLEWIGPRIGPMLSQLGELIGKAANWLIDEGLPLLVDKLKEWGAAFVKWIGPLIPPMLKELGKLLLRIGKWILTDAAPKIAVQALELGVALLGWIADLLPKALSALGSFIGSLVSRLPGLFTSLVSAMLSAGASIGKALIKGLGDGISGLVSTAGDFAGRVAEAFTNVLKSAWNNVIADPVNSAIRIGVDALDKALGPFVNFDDPPNLVPRLAAGGIVTSPTTALIGEAGPEAVIPLDRLGRFGGVEVNITVNGALDPVSVARQIRSLLNSDARQRIGAPVIP